MVHFFKCIRYFFKCYMSGYTKVRYPHTYYTLPTPCRPSPRCFFIIHHMDGTVTVPGHTAGSYSFTERTYREPGSIRLVTSFTYLETQNIQGTRTHQAGHQLHVPGNTEHTGNQDPSGWSPASRTFNSISRWIENKWQNITIYTQNTII